MAYDTCQSGCDYAGAPGLYWYYDDASVLASAALGQFPIVGYTDGQPIVAFTTRTSGIIFLCAGTCAL